VHGFGMGTDSAQSAVVLYIMGSLGSSNVARLGGVSLSDQHVLQGSDHVNIGEHKAKGSRCSGHKSDQSGEVTHWGRGPVQVRLSAEVFCGHRTLGVGFRCQHGVIWHP